MWSEDIYSAPQKDLADNENYVCLRCPLLTATVVN